MAQASLLDTGPVVGLLSAGDEHHATTLAAIAASANQGRILCTTWEVVGEAYTLVRVRLAPARSADAALVALRWARESGIQILIADEADHERAAAILGANGPVGDLSSATDAVGVGFGPLAGRGDPGG